MIFWNKFCGVAAFSFIIVLQANAQSAFLGKSNLSNKKIYSTLKPAAFLSNTKSLQISNNSFAYNLISADYYTKHLGFFCKKELGFEKSTKIPFRFRLGSLQQCNYLEGKK